MHTLDYSTIKVEINQEVNHRIYANTERLHNIFLSNQQITEEIRKKLYGPYNQIIMLVQHPGTIGHNENSPKKEAFRCECCHEKIRVSLIKQPNESQQSRKNKEIFIH